PRLRQPAPRSRVRPPPQEGGVGSLMAEILARLKAALADRYAIDRELGRGGTATVYLAQDLKHGRAVAVKVLRPELAAALGAERFLREIEIAARLTLTHIFYFNDSGDVNCIHFYHKIYS